MQFLGGSLTATIEASQTSRGNQARAAWLNGQPAVAVPPYRLLLRAGKPHKPSPPNRQTDLKPHPPWGPRCDSPCSLESAKQVEQ
ncbi:MAG: hypothetical protein PHS62_02550 [Patescibacteria group bacterium]|nr:hypothetical protein [Patescibacteria group bacterium]